ncbi:hypothetical protein YN1_7240 [Nanoarchaeota archaeon]
MNNKLQWIEIKNYKGIENLKLENFTDINVFIGKNNTGKSSILESIYLTSCKFNKLDYISIKPFLQILERLDYSLYYDFPLFIEGLKYKNKNPEFSSNLIENIEIEFGYDEKDENKYVEGFIKYLYKQNIKNFIKIKIKKSGNVIQNFIIHKYYGDDDYPYIYSYLDITNFPPVIDNENCLLIDFVSIRNPDYSYRLYDKSLDIYGEEFKNKILNILKDYDIKDIEIDKENEIIKIIFKDYSLYYPVLSDSLKSIFYSTLSLYSIKDGIICIEEPENHLHPKSMDLYTKNIIKSVKENNNQIFISTNSLEFLEKLLEYAKKLNINVNIYHLLKVNDKLDYVVYNRDDSLGAIKDIGLDLREEDLI